MPDLDLFGDLHDETGAVIVDDYREDWEPSRDSCWDCAHIARPMHGFNQPEYCALLGRAVCRTSGICSNFARVVK